MQSRDIRRENYESDDQYYWALSNYYSSDEGQYELFEVFKRGLEDGTALTGSEAAAAGRAMLLKSCGLEADSDISTEQLIHICLHGDGSLG